MKSFARAAAVVLCLCLLPLCAFAEALDTHTASDSPVYRSDFTLQLGLDANGFPTGTPTDHKAWQDYLAKLSLRGVIDVQDFLQQFSRVYFDGGLYLNGKNALPFTYDGYYSFRYVRSPALRGASIHFQMYNFPEFMLKPYYMMGLPTQYLMPLMYPEAGYEIGKKIYDPINAALGGTGARDIPYETLSALAVELDEYTRGDIEDFGLLYFYVTSLLIDFEASDAAHEALCDLEGWLEYLDPDHGGLHITADADGEHWQIGQHTVYTHRATEGGESFSLMLPNAQDEALAFDWTRTKQDAGQDLRMALAITSGGEQRIALSLMLEGLPVDGQTEAIGTATLGFGGSLLSASEQRFEFRYSRTQDKLPYSMALGMDWLHPATGKAAVTMLYKADMTEHDNTILIDRAVDNKDDFFNLNESFIEYYKEQFMPTLALAAVPFVLEMPTPVVNDLTSFLYESGLLGMIGLE